MGRNGREVEPKAIVPFFKITLTNLVSVNERLVYTPHPKNPEMYVVSPGFHTWSKVRAGGASPL